MRQRRSLLLSEVLFLIVEVQNRDHEEPGWMYETFNPLPHRPKMETEAGAPSTKEVFNGTMV